MTESKAQMNALNIRTMEMEEMVGTRDQKLKDQDEIIRCQQERLEELRASVDTFRTKAELFDEIQSQVKVSLVDGANILMINLVADLALLIPIYS